jgi:uncharacterized protein
VIVLDTTILSYASGGEHGYQVPCRTLVDAIGASQVRASTTVDVIQEFAHVRARRRPRAEAAGLASRYVSLLSPLLPVGSDDLSNGLDLWRRHERLGSFDAVLAATCMRLGATLVSADKAFARVRGLDFVVPDQKGVGRLIAG